ncbi:hypothetical protein CTAM01_16962, partial [Colletotrichum tamarilloi]
GPFFSLTTSGTSIHTNYPYDFYYGASIQTNIATISLMDSDDASSTGSAKSCIFGLLSEDITAACTTDYTPERCDNATVRPDLFFDFVPAELVGRWVKWTNAGPPSAPRGSGQHKDVLAVFCGSQRLQTNSTSS